MVTRFAYVIAAIAVASAAFAQTLPASSDKPSISNKIEALQNRLDSGTAKLAFSDDGHGYLASLLKLLSISPESQVLVFSKSSLQFDKISPRTPRAIYFSKDVAIGAVVDSNFIELMVNDKTDGIRFYTIDTKRTERPRFTRRTAECTICHGIVNRWSPVMIVADSDTAPDGDLPNTDSAKPFRLTSDTTPFEQRYGGWYVTGQTGAMRHRGNLTVDFSRPLDAQVGELNIDSVAHKIDANKYLSDGSDIVALLTLEHQTGVVNLINQLNAQIRKSAIDDTTHSVSALVQYLTFESAVPLPSAVKGSSSFGLTFGASLPRDSKGRSLGDLDLKSRLFRYPLSFMIYSDAFSSLDPQVKAQVEGELQKALRNIAQTNPAEAENATVAAGLLAAELQR